MARVLMIGGGCRGERLAAELAARGHAVRIVTRKPERRAAVQAAGAECFIGDPDRLVTLRAALEHVTIACWLLASASGEPDAVQALHGSRLAQFLGSAIDTTVRGLVYEAGGSALPGQTLLGGETIALEQAIRNSIPAAVLRSDPTDADAWLAEALHAIEALLAGRAQSAPRALS